MFVVPYEVIFGFCHQIKKIKNSGPETGETGLGSSPAQSLGNVFCSAMERWCASDTACLSSVSTTNCRSDTWFVK